MVDIHIRDISDQSKRMAVVREILEKIGKQNLVFKVAVPSGSRTNQNYHPLSDLEYYGTYRGGISYHGEGYNHFGSRHDELLIKIDSYVETRFSRYGAPHGEGWVVDPVRSEGSGGLYHRKQFFAGEGMIWHVVIKTSDLINITAQASVEPVTVLKEIGA